MSRSPRAVAARSRPVRAGAVASARDCVSDDNAFSPASNVDRGGGGAGRAPTSSRLARAPEVLEQFRERVLRACRSPRPIGVAGHSHQCICQRIGPPTVNGRPEPPGGASAVGPARFCRRAFAVHSLRDRPCSPQFKRCFHFGQAVG